MSIDQRYFRYLDHLGATEPVRALVERPDASDLVALRHDVDHDLDLALEMAFWEHQRGCRATYYLLHSAAYWGDDRLIDKCLQLQDFGHEVGLHLNVVTEWVRGEIDDIDARLGRLLELLRSGGVDLVGVSPHGDRACYERGFINYWIFAELQPDDPGLNESGRSAEGVPVEERQFQIDYPIRGVVERDDGATLALWRSSLASHALRYDAYHVPSDTYLTDSGGTWSRSPDPLELDLTGGRHQVLMHPVYYRGPQRYYLIMSTARSGSKWLSEVLAAGSSVTARHEFTLNHHFDGDKFVAEKRTAEGFRGLMHQPGLVRRLVADARTWVEQEIVGDWAECNVYLAHVSSQVEAHFADATWVHLHRHPYDVVCSLLERGWYETPDDDHHPVIDVEGWESLTQLEKICHYVRRVNEQLLALELPQVALEEVAGDLDDMHHALYELGIAIYPNLLTGVHDQVINASATSPSSISTWSRDARRTLHRICGPIAATLGYRRNVIWQAVLRACLPHSGTPRIRSLPSTNSRPALLLSSRQVSEGVVEVGASGGTIHSIETDQLIVYPNGQRHTWVYLGAQGEDLRRECGIPATTGAFVSGQLCLNVEGSATPSAGLFSLQFDEQGTLMRRRRIRNLDTSGSESGFSFRPPANCYQFLIAVYVPLTPGIERIRIRNLRVEQLATLPPKSD